MKTSTLPIEPNEITPLQKALFARKTAKQTALPIAVQKQLDKFIEEETMKLTNLFDKGIKLYDDAQVELKKLSKPDVKQVTDLEGNILTPEGFSADLAKKIKDQKQKIVNLEDAINLAYSGEIQKLQNIVGN